MVTTKIPAARAAIEALYDAKMTVYTLQKVKDPVTNLNTTKWTPEAALTALPCRLSYKTVSTTNPATGAAKQSQTAQVFTAPEYVIPPGCKISVTAKGRTTEYQQSGPAAVHTNHQEIPLELAEEWA